MAQNVGNRFVFSPQPVSAPSIMKPRRLEDSRSPRPGSPTLERSPKRCQPGNKRGLSEARSTEFRRAGLAAFGAEALRQWLSPSFSRKGGPGITRSDLLVINKTDLAPLVNASLEVMAEDAKRMRGDRPFVFTNLKTGAGLDDVLRYLVRDGMLSQAGLEPALSTLPRIAPAPGSTQFPQA